jgi:hypothetical protein
VPAASSRWMSRSIFIAPSPSSRDILTGRTGIKHIYAHTCSRASDPALPQRGGGVVWSVPSMLCFRSRRRRGGIGDEGRTRSVCGCAGRVCGVLCRECNCARGWRLGQRAGRGGCFVCRTLECFDRDSNQKACSSSILLVRDRTIPVLDTCVRIPPLTVP